MALSIQSSTIALHSSSVVGDPRDHAPRARRHRVCGCVHVRYGSRCHQSTPSGKAPPPQPAGEGTTVVIGRPRFVPAAPGKHPADPSSVASLSTHRENRSKPSAVGPAANPPFLGDGPWSITMVPGQAVMKGSESRSFFFFPHGLDSRTTISQLPVPQSVRQMPDIGHWGGGHWVASSDTVGLRKWKGALRAYASFFFLGAGGEPSSHLPRPACPHTAPPAHRPRRTPSRSGRFNRAHFVGMCRAVAGRLHDHVPGKPQMVAEREERLGWASTGVVFPTVRKWRNRGSGPKIHSNLYCGDQLTNRHHRPRPARAAGRKRRGGVKKQGKSRGLPPSQARTAHCSNP